MNNSRNEWFNSLPREKERTLRLQTKGFGIEAIAKVRLFKKLISGLVYLDDLVQDLATLELEITPDNLLSKTVRKLFGINIPSDMLEPVPSEIAKSKWHEILIKMDKINKEVEGHQHKIKKAGILEINPLEVGSPKLGGYTSLAVVEDLINKTYKSSESTDTLKDSSEAVGNASKHTDVLDK